MKNLLFVIGILVSAACQAQSYKVGQMDADGKLSMTIERSMCSNILEQLSSQRNSGSIHVSEVSFTRLDRGQICLTGYEKDASGNIIKGIRVECSQDDENNLIVITSNYSETVIGRSFDSDVKN